MVDTCRNIKNLNIDNYNKYVDELELFKNRKKNAYDKWNNEYNKVMSEAFYANGETNATREVENAMLLAKNEFDKIEQPVQYLLFDTSCCAGPDDFFNKSTNSCLSSVISNNYVITDGIVNEKTPYNIMNYNDISECMQRCNEDKDCSEFSESFGKCHFYTFGSSRYGIDGNSKIYKKTIIDEKPTDNTIIIVAGVISSIVFIILFSLLIFYMFK